MLRFPPLVPFPRRSLRRSRVLNLALASLLCIAAGGLGYWAVSQWQLDQLRQNSRHQLSFFARSLENLLDKYEHLPFMVSLNGDAAQLLRAPDPARAAAVNGWLSEAQRGTEVAQFYLLDAAGTAVASSEAKLIGQNYRFRPYFQQAMAGQAGIFYGIGATTGLPGCFRSRPIRSGETIIGAAVIKVSLDGLEQAWADSGARLALADENGVVILSTTPGWKYRSLRALPDAVAAHIEASRQYPGTRITPLAKHDLDFSTQGTLIDGTGLPAGDEKWLLQAQRVGTPGWQLLLFADLREVRQTATVGAIGAAFAAAFVLALAFYSRLRRQSHRERLAAREQLEQVSAALETTIVQRTSELSAANQALQQRINELNSTEAILRRTRDDAVQAGKLAVLGQMAAGVSHELNQPLSAMQMLAGNGITLLDLDQPEEVRANLIGINDLVARMGRIVGPLKSFARKSPTRIEPTSLALAIEHALFLLRPNAASHPAEIVLQLDDPETRVVADAIRLEQVLVNLIRNALQAMADTPEPRLEISSHREPTAICLSIRDRGPGFSDEVLPHLFEPFYTTKPQNEGLGLGLAISRAIVESFGGRLLAENAHPGARFLIYLKDASA